MISHINERTPRRIRRDLRGITFGTKSLWFPGTGWGMSMERVIGPTRDKRQSVYVWRGRGGEEGKREREGKRKRSKPTGGRVYQAIRIITEYTKTTQSALWLRSSSSTPTNPAHLVGLTDPLTVGPKRGGHRIPVWVLIANGARTRPHQSVCHVWAIQRPHDIACRVRSHSGWRLHWPSSSICPEDGIRGAHVQSSRSSQTWARGESSKGRRGRLCRCPRGGILAEGLVRVTRVGDRGVGEVGLDTAVVDHAVCATRVGANRIHPVRSLGRFASQRGGHGRDRRRDIISQGVLVAWGGMLVAHH